MDGIHIFVRKSATDGNFLAECNAYPELKCEGRSREEAKNKIIPLIIECEHERYPDKVQKMVQPRKVKFGF